MSLLGGGAWCRQHCILKCIQKGQVREQGKAKVSREIMGQKRPEVKTRVADAWVVKALGLGGTEWIKAWGSLQPFSHPSVCKRLQN